MILNARRRNARHSPPKNQPRVKLSMLAEKAVRKTVLTVLCSQIEKPKQNKEARIPYGFVSNLVAEAKYEFS